MIKLVATLCRLASPFDCHDQAVTSNTSMSECMLAVRSLGDWSQQFPAYEVRGWKCQAGSKATERGV